LVEKLLKIGEGIGASNKGVFKDRQKYSAGIPRLYFCRSK